MKTPLWRQAVVVPAAATLIVGGMVLLATPAVAAPLAAPVATSTAAPLATASAAPSAAPTTAAATPVATPTVAPSAAPTAVPTPPVTAAPTPTPTPTAPVTPPTVVKGVAVTAPKTGAVLTTRTTVFTGAAPTGATIVIADANGSLLGTTKVVGTSFSIPVTFGIQAAAAQTVTVTGATASGSVLAPVVVKLTLPASSVPALVKPVILTPSVGQKIVGNTLTFSGTATPGTHVVLLVLKTSVYEQLKAQNLSAAEMAAGTSKVTITNNQPIKTRADGTWKISTGLSPLDDYTVIAQSVSGDGVTLSPISSPVEFKLVAAVVPAAVTTVATGSDSGDTLAYTGSNSAPIAGIGGLLLLGGVGLSIAAWRKRRLA